MKKFLQKVFGIRRLGVEKELEDLLGSYLSENEKLKRELRSVCVEPDTFYSKKIIAEQKFLNNMEEKLWAGSTIPTYQNK